MKHFISTMLTALAVASVVVSCSDYDNGYTSNEIQYKQSFKETFGQIDPTQDWNLATRATVTVTTNSSTNVKIFALTDGTYKLVADYADVTGTKELGFDVREDVTDLMVTNGSTAVKAKIGESVSFGATRAGHYGTTGDVKVTEITDENSWFVFNKEEALKYQEKLPEGGKDWDGDGNKENNLGQVTQNFTFISNGEFTIYPIYWQTSNTDEIGVYFTDASGYHEVPVYTIKSGDELQYTSTNASTSFDYCYASDAYENDQSKVGKECAGCSNGGIVTKVDDSGRAYHTKTTPAAWSNVTASPTSDHFDWGAQYERSKGIKVSIPKGTLFGMYIKPLNGIKQYSQQEKNAMFYNSPNKDVVAATFTLPSASNSNEDDMYLCFEDWQTSSCDADLNDVVFRFYGSTPTVIDEDPTAWVICAEDLGNTFDIDYNDVVVEVKHVSGKENVTVSPIAAGGTLASYIFFNDKTNGETCLGEIHELLGQSNAKSGEYNPINVFGSVNTSKIKDYTFNVSETWSLASSTVGDESFNSDAAMGGFSVKVVPEGTQASESAASIYGQKIQNSTAKGSENVPYIFCVPRDYKRTYTDSEGNSHEITAWFRWSNELKSLYPLAGYGSGTYSTSGHAFAEWVANKNSAKDWYQYPSDMENTTGILYTDVTVDANSGDGENSGSSEDEGNNEQDENKITCIVSEKQSIQTSWGASCNGQTINIPSEGVSVGDKLYIKSSGANKDFGDAWGSSSIKQGNQPEIEITENMIGKTIYVTLYDANDAITSAYITKAQ